MYLGHLASGENLAAMGTSQQGSLATGDTSQQGFGTSQQGRHLAAGGTPIIGEVWDLRGGEVQYLLTDM